MFTCKLVSFTFYTPWCNTPVIYYHHPTCTLLYCTTLNLCTFLNALVLHYQHHIQTFAALLNCTWKGILNLNTYVKNWLRKSFPHVRLVPLKCYQFLCPRPWLKMVPPKHPPSPNLVRSRPALQGVYNKHFRYKPNQNQCTEYHSG